MFGNLSSTLNVSEAMFGNLSSSLNVSETMFGIPNSTSNTSTNVKWNSMINLKNESLTTSFQVNVIIKLSVHFVIFILGTIGNLLLTAVILQHRSMQCATNWFVFNLAMSDLGLTVINIPLTNIYHFTGWPFGEPLCKYFLGSFGECIVGVSVFTHTALGLVRYQVVLHPMKPKIRLRHVRIGIVLIWIAAYACLSAPINGKFQLVYSSKVKGYVCRPMWPSFEYRIVYRASVFITTYLIPMIIATFCYVKIFTALKRSMKFLEKGSAATSAQMKRREYKSKRLTKALYVIYTIFAVTTLPLEIFYVLIDSRAVPLVSSMADVWSMLVALFYSLSVMNPFMLFYMSEDYRNQLYNLFYNKLCCGNAERSSGSSRWTKSSRLESNTQNFVFSQLVRRDSRKFAHKPLKMDPDEHEMQAVGQDIGNLKTQLLKDEKKETLV